MASEAAINLVIGLKDRATGPLGKLAGTLGKVGKAATVLGAGALLGVGAGFVKAASAGLGFNNSMEQATARINAFTGDAAATADILEMVRARAAKTPFAFEEMAAAAASLGPVSRSSGVDLETLISKAEILAASNPAQGFEGAVLALKEATGGDWTSIIERFDLPRQRLKELAAQGVPAVEAITIAMGEMGLNADLVSNMANTASGRWSTLMDTFTTLAATITQPIFAGVSQGMGDLQVLLDANMPKIQEFATLMGEKVGAAMSWLAGTAIPGMIGAWQSLQPAIAIGIELFGHLADLLTGNAFEDTIPNITEILTGIGTTIVTTLQGWGQAFVGWIAPYIPVVLEHLGTLATSIYNWILEKAPGILEQLGTWAVQFTAWVLPLIPKIVGELGNVASAILGWIGDQLPVIGAKANEWAPALTKWIQEIAIPTLGPAFAQFDAALGAQFSGVMDRLIAVSVEKTRQLISVFIAELAATPAKMLPVLDQWSVALFGWLDRTAAAMPGRVAKMIDAFLQAWRDKQAEWLPTLDRWVVDLEIWADDLTARAAVKAAVVGAEFIAGVSGALTDGLVTVTVAMTSILDSIVDVATGYVSSFVSVGSDIVAGIAEGIGAGAIKVAAAAIAAVTGALKAAQDAILARSPSKLWKVEIGFSSIDGIIQGMKDRQQKLNAMAKLVVVSALKEASDGTKELAYDVGYEAGERFVAGVNDSLKARLRTIKESFRMLVALGGDYTKELLGPSLKEQIKNIKDRFQELVDAGEVAREKMVSVAWAMADQTGEAMRQLVAYLKDAAREAAGITIKLPGVDVAPVLPAGGPQPGDAPGGIGPKPGSVTASAQSYGGTYVDKQLVLNVTQAMNVDAEFAGLNAWATAGTV